MCELLTFGYCKIDADRRIPRDFADDLGGISAKSLVHPFNLRWWINHHLVDGDPIFPWRDSATGATDDHEGTVFSIYVCDGILRWLTGFNYRDELDAYRAVVFRDVRHPIENKVALYLGKLWVGRTRWHADKNANGDDEHEKTQRTSPS